MGREIYVSDVEIATNTISLNAQLYDAIGTQEFTFMRFKYMLDFSGFTKISDMIFDHNEFACGGEFSGVMLPSNRLVFQVRDCSLDKPKNRGMTSQATGCQGIIIDRNMFVSDEQAIETRNRQSIAFNVNANDPQQSRGAVPSFLCVAGQWQHHREQSLVLR